MKKKGETEPARILTTIFKDDEGRYHELTVSTPSIEKDDLRECHPGVDYIFICSFIILHYYHFRMGILPVIWRSALCTSTLAGRLSNRKRNKPLSNDTQITEFRKLNEAAIRYVERTEQMFEQQKTIYRKMLHMRYKLHLLSVVTDWKMLMEDDSLSEKTTGRADENPPDFRIHH